MGYGDVPVDKGAMYYGDLILRVLDYIVAILLGYILYCVCFNLDCGGFILFCNVWGAVCMRGFCNVWVCVCVCSFVMYGCFGNM